MTQLSLDPAVNLESRIQDVLAGLNAPWPLTPKQGDLLELLRPHKGRALARPISAIADVLGMSEREVKSSVKSLVEDFGLPIGASRQEPYEYFLIVSADDLEFALRPLANEVISIARRMRRLGGSDLVKETLGQLRMEMEA